MVIWAEELKHRAVNRASNIRLIGWLIIKKVVIKQEQFDLLRIKALVVCGFKGTPDFLAINAHDEN